MDLIDSPRGDDPRTNSTDPRLKLKSEGGHAVGMLTLKVWGSVETTQNNRHKALRLNGWPIFYLLRRLEMQMHSLRSESEKEAHTRDRFVAQRFCALVFMALLEVAFAQHVKTDFDLSPILLGTKVIRDSKSHLPIRTRSVDSNNNKEKL
jgi:hypothetical protein